MTYEELARLPEFLALNELGRARVVAYFFLKSSGVKDFSASQIGNWLSQLGFPKPNTSRLKTSMRESKAFVSVGDGKFRLHPTAIVSMEQDFPDIADAGGNNELVVSSNLILPEPVFSGTRGFVEKLCHQINCSYEKNIFDGCAVLMRRLVEVLLILAYRHKGFETEIRGSDGNYISLDRLIALTNTKLSLSQKNRDELSRFRELGNFSAHGVEYNCRRDDLKHHLLDYRVLIETLLYEAGLRK